MFLENTEGKHDAEYLQYWDFFYVSETSRSIPLSVNCPAVDRKMCMGKTNFNSINTMREIDLVFILSIEENKA